MQDRGLDRAESGQGEASDDGLKAVWYLPCDPGAVANPECMGWQRRARLGP